MALPESPKTRSEMYLDGIAKGSISGIPSTPVTRMEMYLDYIARNGGGGGGGGDSGLVVAHATVTALPEHGDESFSITLDKTFAELAAAEYSVIELKVTNTDRLYHIPLHYTILYSDNEPPASLGYVLEEAGVYIEIGVEARGAVLGTVRNPALEPFVLTSDNFDMTTFTGTIDQSSGELEAALEANRRLFVQLFGTTAELTVHGNTPTSELLSSTFIFNTGSLAGVVLAKAIVYVDNTDPDNPTLMLRAEMYQITPVSGS